MKKVIAGVLILFSIGITQVNAQTISGGIKVDADMSGFLLTKFPGAKSKLRFGASLGGFMEIGLSGSFALRPELLLKSRHSKLESTSENVKNDYQYLGVEIPVYALGQFQMGDGKFYAGAGPYIGCGFSAKFKEGDKKDDLYEGGMMKRFDFGAGILAGYEFSNKMQLSAGYRMGLTNLIKGGGDTKFRNHELSLGIGYRF
ncbi:MAG: PorT family protein [Prevotella sp.]|jgi:opacity protein-like surface antigen|nr:PorT family protein [Prevotella sp.]